MNQNLFHIYIFKKKYTDDFYILFSYSTTFFIIMFRDTETIFSHGI